VENELGLSIAGQRNRSGARGMIFFYVQIISRQTKPRHVIDDLLAQFVRAHCTDE